jgi:hypothetical protein
MKLENCAVELESNNWLTECKLSSTRHLLFSNGLPNPNNIDGPGSQNALCSPPNTAQRDQLVQRKREIKLLRMEK